MTTVLIIVVILAVLFLLFTLLRIRVRLDISPDSKTLFVGVGRTGITTDLEKGLGTISFSGMTFRAKPFKWKFRIPEAEIRAMPRLIRAFWRFGVSILKSFTVEKLQGELNAGFSEPHLTGYAYGFYWATLAGFPGAAQTFRFNPDWTGASVRGKLNAEVSIPIYRIIYRSMVLFFSLPFRDLTKMAIGRKARLEQSRKDRKQNGRA